MPAVITKKILKISEGNFACSSWSVSWFCRNDVLKKTLKSVEKYLL